MDARKILNQVPNPASSQSTEKSCYSTDENNVLGVTGIQGK